MTNDPDKRWLQRTQPVAAAASGEVERVGRYIVQRKLGEGGMGVVLAAQDPELGRQVALKFVRGDKHSEHFQARLLREAQSAAALSHPNVVVVYDVGRHEDSLYVAMELVDGQTAREWLEQQPRNWREVLDLYLAAGRGLAAAHAAGLVHRDFKPSNVLVGNDGRVRVADFGLARPADVHAEPEADGAPASGSSSLTQTGAIMGTPRYMSPEQMRGDRIDHRSDQYSFCVALQEALGNRVSDDESTRPLPSSSNITQTSESSGVPPRVLRALARGTAEPPDDRFESMDALLAELEGGEPQRRPGWLYALPAVVVLGLLGWLLLFPRAAIEPAAPCALAGKDMTAWWQNARSQLPASTARLTLEHLDRYATAWDDMSAGSCRATNVTRTQSATLLDRRTSCLQHHLRVFKRIVGALQRGTVRDTNQVVLNLPSIAECGDTDRLGALKVPKLSAADKTRARELNRNLADAVASNLEGDYVTAVSLAAKTAKQAARMGHAPLEAAALTRMGIAQNQLGKLQAAVRALRRAIAAAARAGDPETEAMAWMALIHIAIQEAARFRDLLPLETGANGAIERAGNPAGLRIRFHRILGAAHARLGKLASAEKHLRTALKLLSHAPGIGGRLTASVYNDLGNVLAQRGNLRGSEKMLRRAIALAQQLYGPDHINVSIKMDNLGVTLTDLGRPRAAIELHRRALEIREPVVGPNHRSLSAPLENLARAQVEIGATNRAIRTYRRALAIVEHSYGPHHPTTAGILDGLGKALTLAHDDGDVATLQRALAIRERLFGRNHGLVARTHYHLALAFERRKDYARAEKHARRSADTFTKAGALYHEHLLLSLMALGRAEHGQRHDRAATATLEKAQQIAASLQKVDPVLVAKLHFALGQSLAGSDRNRARRLVQQAREQFAKAKRVILRDRADRWLRGH